MGILIVIIITLIIGGVCGYKIATRVLRIEHQSLVRQNYMLTNWSNQWANSAQYHRQVEDHINKRNGESISTTLNMVIRLMATIQNNTQSEILYYIGYFGYLTVFQLRKLIRNKELGYLRNLLAQMSGEYIKSFQVHLPTKVREANTYYLTPRGKDVLFSNEKTLGKIRSPLSGAVTLTKDVLHRRAFTDVFISLYMHLNGTDVNLDTFLTYYDKVGNRKKDNNLQSVIAIPLNQGHYIPDGIMITEQDGNNKLYVIEMYCDDSRNSGRVLRSLAQNVKAISTGAVGKKFGLQCDPAILCVFDDSRLMQSIINKLKDNEQFQPVSSLFFFASLDDVKMNCSQAWQTIIGDKLQF